MLNLRMNITRIFRPTILLALALMGVILMMVLPVPAFVLDIGLALSFALAILMLTVTLFIERPLDFSAFPTILLASLMLRLSLNVSSTKLIIGQGHTGTDAAGHVIEGFAEFIMGGNLLLGLVVFCVLLIVNFVVITKGAGRMAEVGARFALDGMPGKQLAIDADMAAGAITHAEAKARRERELAETNFFGSLDGASKFVKGDAVAGLLITVLNIVMGLIMGVFVHGMPLGEAFETYSILTVGDGLVSQIPAVIISVAAALLLARSGATGAADVSFFAQLGRFPGALGTVALLMALIALVPGMPFLPFMIGAVALGLCRLAGASARRRHRRRTGCAPRPALPMKKSIGDVLDFDEIHIEFAPNLVSMVLDPATGLDSRIANMRNHVAATFGLILPEIRLTDEASLPPGTYRIRLQGVERVRDRLFPERVLVLLADGISAPDGMDVREPVYGAPARWIRPDMQEDAVLAGLTVVSAARGAGDPPAGGDQRQSRAAVVAARSAAPAGRIHQDHRPGPGRTEQAPAGRAGARKGAGRHPADRPAPAAGGAGLDPQPAPDPRSRRRGAQSRQPRGDLRTCPPAAGLPAGGRAEARRRHDPADPAGARMGKDLRRPPDRRRPWPARRRPAARPVQQTGQCHGRSSEQIGRGRDLSRRWSPRPCGGVSCAP